MNDKRRNLLMLGGIILLAVALLLPVFFNQTDSNAEKFNAERAFEDVVAQMELSPRTPGSEAHQLVIEYIQKELKKSGWQVEIQNTERLGHPIQNIIAKRGSGAPWIIFGAHYDSRLVADHDPLLENQTQPVPGANDGASGVAVLLEMARVLPKNPDQSIWLVFFDAEDQGRIEGWDWIMGSRAFAESLTTKPEAVVIVDMIGDKDLNIYREMSSSQSLNDSIWQTAASLGYEEYLINQDGYNMLDDHTPFLEAGINAVDIIDFDYAYWHTTSDVTEKVSKESLAIVGNTLLTWLDQFLSGE